jgi:uncharacterized protein (DUF1800 family)
MLERSRFSASPFRSGLRAAVRSGIQSGAAALLCLLLPVQVLPAQAPLSAAKPAGAAVIASSDRRILHLLSRFTFGPKPEDIAAVRSLGPHAIDLWFNQQLHPDNLPDTVLTARLAEYPAMLLPVGELIQRFPSNAEIRQAANGKRPVPKNQYLGAVYRRHVALFEDKQAKKAQEKQAEAAQTMSAKGGEMKPVEGMAPGVAMASSTNGTGAAKPGDRARPSYADLEVKTVLGLPPVERVQRILAMQPAEYEQFHSSLKGPQKALLTADLDAAQRELLADYDNPTRAVVEELQNQRLMRDIYSSHQLEEVMTTFWLNHFNVYLHKNDEAPYYLVSYERDVIRPRALGNFESLLVATAQSPAMQLYLDNSSSTGPDSEVALKHHVPMFGKDTKPAPGLNENYARELMELHTLGVNGGYTQKDVTEVARIFTGWTVEKPQQGGGTIFDETRHEPGKKIVMGHKFKEDGQKEGLALLHMLATSPATAHFISQELAIQFVSDAPPQALVNRMAAAFLRTAGDIPSVLRTMLHSPEFWSPEAYQAKVKTPLEYVVSAARASGAEIDDPRPLVNALNQMGMPLYACVPPTGYSAKADAWVSTGALVTRMNFALSLATNHYGGIKSTWSTAAAPLATPEEAEQALEAKLVPGGVSDKTRTAVLDQSAQALAVDRSKLLFEVYPPESQPVNAKQPDPKAQMAALERQDAQIAGLLIGSPEFQRR